MSSELQFERLTKAAVASFYMYLGTKVVQIERNAKQIVIYLHFQDAAYFRGNASKLLVSLHIPILFVDYLMNSYQF